MIGGLGAQWAHQAKHHTPHNKNATDINVNGWRPSPMEALLAFQSVVRTEGGWPTFIRVPRGREEAAACGQLATEVAEGARRGKQQSKGTGSDAGGDC